MTTLLVVAKAPVPGKVKTRLAKDVGDAIAADVAAAALLDTIEACTVAVGAARCRLALSGDLRADGAGASSRAEVIRASLTGWTVVPQHGDGLGERLAHAHSEVTGPVVQIGMDTPQVSPQALLAVAGGLDSADAVLAPAEDGGWWALALRDPSAAAALRDVPMSTPETYAATRSALERLGLRVVAGERLRDVDHLADVAPVAAAAPLTHFAAVAARIVEGPR
ncbi:MAG: TIGR04282 family arsenosugar biosynthesis glycosyltransferase [Nocardioides sp.]|uniref:TIGR04282 family arsenosugar biosynthesis glycosyltransferase n=1 Tax=Nocardioides sp. TaxID=35761 RepID=UPI003D6B170F